MKLAILFSLKTMELLENGLQTHSGVASRSSKTPPPLQKMPPPNVLVFLVAFVPPDLLIHKDYIYPSQHREFHCQRKIPPSKIQPIEMTSNFLRTFLCSVAEAIMSV